MSNELLLCLCHTSVESVNCTSTEDAFFTSVEWMRCRRDFDINKRICLTIDFYRFLGIECWSRDKCVAGRELFETDFSVLWVDIFFHKKLEKYDGIIKTLPEMQVFRLILTIFLTIVLVCDHTILSTLLAREEFCPFLSEWSITLNKSC